MCGMNFKYNVYYNGALCHYRYRLRHAGVYTVKVRAVSLAGHGDWSEGLPVSVAQTSTAYLLYVILIPVLVVVLIVTVLASGFMYVKYKASNVPEMTQNVIYHNIVSLETYPYFQNNNCPQGNYNPMCNIISIEL